ncbi:cysteine hydrolase [Pseudoxanthomonas daejeonensis]|uniref:Isochorismatase n=1 Tax=Pseudoxanthomonas daejeonensis TaxID=266062 RepID=A0ABQ6Z6E8_9GAMM|nr:isochorismatase family cysteine hydrolase [Pseudoxanthomonas daejeonensis]KAF1694101.1 isochorismatase [Pseudoxanthomonas daejeonensis]UNK57236.1 cysteine hydrolase [Pseudoxanthomonas daejeonensis]
MASAKDTALLILDMVNLFDFEGGGRLARDALSIVPALSALRARFDAAGAPVVYVNDNFTHWQGEFSDLIGRCIAAGGVPATIVGRLRPAPHHYYILKPKHSAFLATALPVLLAKLGVRRLVVTGLAADSCVLVTAQDANMREYRLWVPRDCVAAQTPARKEGALAIVRTALLGDVRSSARMDGLFPV